MLSTVLRRRSTRSIFNLHVQTQDATMQVYKNVIVCADSEVLHTYITVVPMKALRRLNGLKEAFKESSNLNISQLLQET